MMSPPRKDHLKELLQFYYNILSSKLDELGHDSGKIYAEEEFLKDYNDSMPFMYSVSLMHAMVGGGEVYHMPWWVVRCTTCHGGW